MISHQALFERLRQSEAVPARLLPDLLEGLQWPGEAIQLRNAISGSPQQMDAVDLLNTMANLGYRWEVKPVSDFAAASAAYPLLLRRLHPNAELRLVSSAEQLAALSFPAKDWSVYQFVLEPNLAGEQRQWFQAQILRFRGGIGELYVMSLLIALLTLVLPFYIRAVYNLEIPGGQPSDLLQLFPFALVGVLLQLWLTQRRQARLADLGAELDLILTLRVLEKVLRLRLPQLERYTPLTLTARLRGVQALRTYLTGPVALAALDLPFIGIYLIALAVMSVPLMLLTVLMVMVCYGGVYLVGWLGRAVQQPLSRNPAQVDGLLLDLVENLPQIKRSAAERLWSARLEVASSEAALQGLGPLRLQSLLAILTGEFSQLTGALVLAAGAGLAMAGNDGIELGTLIAAMFFVWRVFRPIQMAYQAISRWSQMRPTLEQLNRFMAAAEVEPSTSRSERWVLPRPKGALTFRNVNLRLNALQEPTLSQLNLSIPAGHLVVLTGPEGAGTSSVLRLINAQITPGSGVISLDGYDLRQIPLGQLREAVAYLAEQPGVFPATLRENLLLAGPFLTDDQLRQVLRDLALDELLQGPGLDRRIALQGADALLPHQQQGVALARMLLVDPTVLLLDQPLHALRPENVQALIQKLMQRRGRSTTVVVSDAPELLKQADQIVVLRDGALAFAGTPAELLAAQQKAVALSR